MIALAVLLLAQCPDGSPPPCPGARSRPAAAAPAGSIAVLPFVNRSADSGDAYLAEALPEQIAGRLHRIRQLSVKSATAAQAQWRRTPDPAQAARALRVEWYVTGSIRRIGRQLSVNAELVRAASGDGVWSAPFRRSDNDLAAIEEQIAESVAVGVAGRLAPAELGALRERRSRNVEAYRHYLLGTSLLTRRTASDIGRAVASFEAAVRHDSSFAAAWGRLGFARSLQIQWGGEDALPGDSLARLSRAAVERALALDSNSSEAWQALVTLRTVTQEPDLERTHAAIRRALALDSLNADNWHALAYLYGANQLALAEPAERFARRALELNPDLRNTWRLLSDVKLLQGLDDEALAFADSALARGTWAYGYFLRSGVRWVRGDYRGALQDLDQAARSEGLPASGRAEMSMRRAIIQLSLGDSAAARGLLAAAEQQTASGRVQYFDLALLYALFGRRDDALAVIERLTALPGGGLRCGSRLCSRSLRTWRLLHHPVLRPMRDHPRVRQLLDETRPVVSWEEEAAR